MHRRNCALICYQDNASVGWAVRGIIRIRVFSVNGNKVGNKPLTQEEEGRTATIDQRKEFGLVSSFVIVSYGIGTDRRHRRRAEQKPSGVSLSLVRFTAPVTLTPSH